MIPPTGITTCVCYCSIALFVYLEMFWNEQYRQPSLPHVQLVSRRTDSYIFRNETPHLRHQVTKDRVLTDTIPAKQPKYQRPLDRHRVDIE